MNILTITYNTTICRAQCRACWNEWSDREDRQSVPEPTETDCLAFDADCGGDSSCLCFDHITKAFQRWQAGERDPIRAWEKKAMQA
jgi:hypothetical protein